MDSINKPKEIVPLDVSLDQQIKIRQTITDAINANLLDFSKEKFNAYNLIDAIMSVLNDLGFDILLVSEVYYNDANAADDEFTVFTTFGTDIKSNEQNNSKSKIPNNFDIDKLEDAIDDLMTITDLDTINPTNSIIDTPFQYAYKTALKGIFYDYLENVLDIL